MSMALPEEAIGYRPELIVAHRDPRRADLLAAAFGQHGWRVRRAGSGRDARALAAALDAPTVLLSTEQDEESGWLTCAKLRLERPRARVFLLAPAVTAEERRYATFVGAAGLLGDRDDLHTVVKVVCGVRISVAG
jgi:DNA-binding response OmpR family regulator